MAVSSEAMTAAAILACEASRQQLETMKAGGPRDVPGELLQLYHWYLDQLSGSAQSGGVASPMPAARRDPPARSW